MLSQHIRRLSVLFASCISIFIIFIEHVCVEYCRETLKNGELLQKKTSDEHGNDSECHFEAPGSDVQVICCTFIRRHDSLWTKASLAIYVIPSFRNHVLKSSHLEAIKLYFDKQENQSN